MELEAGARLLHYRILDTLGRGGMGIVYLAQDTRLERQVALKLLPEEVAADPRRLERFRREAKAVAAINHPHIVTLYAVEEADGLPFIVMEYVEGKTLDRLLPDGGLTIDRFFELALPLADALAAAHARGIVHRDLKPKNVMVGNDGRLRILDFGLAKAIPGTGDPEAESEEPQLTRDGVVLGTVPYMSPEQLQGEPLDHRSDLFSLGLTFYQMLTGRHPFGGERRASLISALLRDQPPPLGELRPELPPYLDRIVGRCLEKEPARRYQDTRHLCDDLESLRRELTREDFRRIDTVEADAPGPLRRLSVSRRLLLPLAGLLVLLAAGLAFLIVVSGGARADPPHSLAVLPFANFLGDASQDHLCDGLSVGLISDLSEVTGLRVVGRSEAWSEEVGDSSLRELGRRLSVETLLEGEVTGDRERLAVAARLTEARTGFVLWSQRFEGSRERLFELQRQITEELTRWFSVRLSRRERRRLARDPTRSLKAYEHYSRGMRQLEGRGSELDPELAAESFRQALRLDPEFALAEVGLAEALLRRFQQRRDPDLMTAAEAATVRALELDARLPEGLVMRARLERQAGNVAASIDDLEGVLALHPKPDEAYRHLAYSYTASGQHEEAQRCLELAVSINGADWTNWNALGAARLHAGNYDEARVAFRRAVELAPAESTWPLENLGVLALSEGDFEAAVAVFERIDTTSLDAAMASNMGVAFFYTGRLDRAESLYAMAIELRPQEPIAHGNLGDLYVRQGREQLARQSYRRALELTETALAVDPENRRLRRNRMLYAAKAADCEPALLQLGELRTATPSLADAHIGAYVHALCSDADEALAALETAIELGLAPALAAEEDEFRSLREHPGFRRLVGLETFD